MFIARLFCASSLSTCICFTGVRKSIPSWLITLLTGYLLGLCGFFPSHGENKAAFSGHLRHSLSPFLVLIMPSFLPDWLEEANRFLCTMAVILQHSCTLPLFFQEPILIPSLTRPLFLPLFFQQICQILFLFGPQYACRKCAVCFLKDVPYNYCVLLFLSIENFTFKLSNR